MTKEFLNEIRQKRITEVKNFKMRHRELLKRLSGIIEKKKIPKIKTRTERKSDDGVIWIGPKVARWIEKEPRREKVT